jgi:hypothetical protein
MLSRASNRHGCGVTLSEITPAEIAAEGRPKGADAPMNQSREAHHPARPLHSPEGTSLNWPRPYHGSDAHRRAIRRLRRSRDTVSAAVMGPPWDGHMGGQFSITPVKKSSVTSRQTWSATVMPRLAELSRSRPRQISGPEEDGAT